MILLCRGVALWQLSSCIVPSIDVGLKYQIAGFFGRKTWKLFGSTFTKVPFWFHNRFDSETYAYSLGDVYPKHTIASEMLFPCIYASVSNIRVMIPAVPSEILKGLYGANYIIPPPEEKRLGHFRNLVRVKPPASNDRET